MEYEFQYIKNKNKILELGPSGASMIFTPSSFGGMQKLMRLVTLCSILWIPI